ncbi:MAG: right-handed parallel beta-helix repeat-containing protein, partial [Acidobacteria bacterium]|nr:right-handed parallel beta-helix repeat-containing protein [Acidobacteriota bacterium]
GRPGLLRKSTALLLALLLIALALPALMPTRVEAQNSGGASSELIPSGSLIIPMDNTLQAIGTPFNLRAYGMVERLLWAGIPVKWAIAPGKAKDGVDFTATAQRISPSAAGAASLSFSGGPFVVHRDFAVPALTVINAYAPANNVAVYQTTADATVSVRHTLTHKPKVAVFDDGASATIHTTYLNAAGFISGTHYNIIPAATLVTVNASACYTIGTEPHFGASAPASDPQVNAIRQFVQSGGNFLAECEGITTYENNPTYGRFQTTTGVIVGNARTGIQYPSPDLPYSQFIGAMADVGGSVRDFQPLSGGAYRASAEMHARSPSGSLGGGQAGILPAKGTVSRLSGPSVGGFVFYLGGHEYSTSDLDNINGIRMYLNAVMTPSGRPSGCGLTLTPRTISGTVYEDVNGDSQLADGVVRSNVSARLYQDANNNGVVDTGDTFLLETTTSVAGAYSFNVAPQATGNNYLVAVDSKDVTPTAGLIAGRGDTWVEQTYGDNPATAALDVGSRFGGRQSAVSDNFNNSSTTPASNTYEHLARADVSAGNISNANFGFSFNVVTSTRGGDAADDDTSSAGRTVQGSLRQFIQNANAVNGANYMRFVPAVAANAGGATYWQVSVTTALAAVIDASTTLDGTAYNNSNGTSSLDTNTGSLGAGGTVGVNNLTLSQVQRPELEVLGSGGIAVGLDLQANSLTVRRLAVRGFGTTPNNDNSANIRIGSNFTGTLAEQNFLGVVANAGTFTTSAATSTGDNIRSVGGDSGTIRDNLIGFSSGKGIQLGGTSTGWLVENNEVRFNGIGNANLNGLDIENGSGNCTVRGNLFVANEAAGVDMYQSSGGNTIESNTITGNGIGSGATAETPGVRVYGAGSTVSLNIINANFGAGVMVTSSASANTITRNSIFANGTITNKSGAGPSNQIGIDLLSVADNQLAGTSPFVTVNDSGDGDAGGNGLLNFPILTSARIIGGNITLQGYSRPGATIEFFIAAADPSGFGEAQTYLVTLTEGSAADTDAGTGTYTSPVNGLNVGTDTTSLFQFTIPVPAGVAIGTTLTATATIGSNTSEFSGNITVAAAPPNVTLVKDCTAPADCTTASQPPGTDLTYNINFANTGGAPAQTFIITDPIPANTDFKVGSVTTNLGTTGMTVTIAYSNDGAATWTYTPVSGAGSAPTGYDRIVTHVRWSFAGNLSQAVPNNTGSVGFIVRIR